MTEAITILPPVTSSQESPPAEIATMKYEPLPNPSKLIQKGSFEPLHQVWPSLFFFCLLFLPLRSEGHGSLPFLTAIYP